MNTLNKFRKRNIQTNLYHFVLVIFVVAISVCLLLGLVINYFTLKKCSNKFFVNSNMPNLWLETNQITHEDDEFFSSKFEFGKRYKFKDEFFVSNKSYNGTFLISDGKTSTPYIVEGERDRGCYIDEKFAKKHEFGINYSNVSIDYEMNGEIKRLSFKVVGFISFAEYFVSDESDCKIFIEESYFLETLKNNFDDMDNADLDALKYNEILIKSEVSNQDMLDIENYYKKSSSTLNKMYLIDELGSVIELKREIEIARNMIFIFPIIFVVISILVVISAISQLVAKERYNIGLLKSLGISNKQILSNYCGYGVWICVIGAVLGLIVAPLIVPNISLENYYKLFNLPRAETKIYYSWLMILIVIVSAAILGYLSALFVVLEIINKTPRECMNHSKKVRLKSRERKLNVPVMIGGPIRNMKLNISRTLMSIFGIAGCSLLSIIGFGVNASLTNKNSSVEYYSLRVFSSIFKGFAICLMILTIIILITQIFKEREKEMAMLRIHGENHVSIWLSVLLEMVFIGMIGFVISTILSSLTMLLNTYIFGINEYFSINFMSFLKTFLIVFLTIILASLIGLIKICKLKLSESIKFSE